MHAKTHLIRRIQLALTLGAALAAVAPSAMAQTPDFDAVAWQPLGAGVAEPAGDESPSAVDLVGDAAHAPAFSAHDATFLYLRYRVDGDPTGSGGFQSYAWNTLAQVPSGNPFQYQYEFSVNGKSDTVEIWANTSAMDIDFSPLFNDPAEVQLFSQAAGTGPLARHVVASDSTFGGNADYFVDAAFPVATLVAKGVIATAADLDATLFFPATATNANNFNKGYLNAPFSPGAVLAIDKTVAPTVVPAGSVTPVTYTIAVHNDGPAHARGVVVTDPSLPSYLSGTTVGVAADDASVTWTVVSTKPLVVKVNDLPSGATVTVTISASAAPTCGDNSFVNVATASATNAPEVQASAILTVNLAAGGCTGCTADAECDDANACTTDVCAAGSCASTAIPGCVACTTNADCPSDGNVCTSEVCVAGSCSTAPDPACAPCATDLDCSDADPCSIDACVAGACTSNPNPTCGALCTTDADCANDGNACTSERCQTGTCAVTIDPSCTACLVDGDCNDGDACTTDACVAGACVSTPIVDCSTNPPEDCSNGSDDDGDGLIDCSDPDCADAPNCVATPVEICGDCTDNDGDGLTDYEDPDCCAAPQALDVRRMMLQPAPKRPNAKRLRLKVRDTGFAPASLDPRHADTTLQISDPDGTIVCQKIPAAAWTHRNPRSFRFLDKSGTLAGGLKRARFAMKRTGRVPFRVVGKSVVLGATHGRDVKVTLGVGGQCSQTMTQLRAKGVRMILP
jgi:uncharacterized repeat protein (TIGR01451 family)